MNGSLINTAKVSATNSAISVGGDNLGILNTGTINLIPPGEPHQKLTIKWNKELKKDDFALLSWNSAISDLQGRNNELADLLEWAINGNGIRARFISGVGGVGKTRLAMECGRKLQEQEGWEAGQFNLQKGIPCILGKTGTLLIIDYPEENTKEVHSFLRELAGQDDSPNLCVLFLTRGDDKFWQNELDKTGASILFAGQKPVTLSSIKGITDPYTMFQEAWQNAGTIYESASVGSQLPTEHDFLQWLDRDKLHRLPLFITACALQHHHNPNTLTLAGSEIVNALIRRELKRLRNESLAAGLEETALPRLIAMAAITKGLTPDNLKELASQHQLEIIRCDPTRVVDTILKTGRMTDGLLPRPEPDIIAAGFVENVFNQRKDLVSEWLWFAIKDNITERLDTLRRLLYDAEYVLGKSKNPISSQLAAVFNGNPLRCNAAAGYFYKVITSISLLPGEIAIWNTLAENSSDDEGKARFLNNLGKALLVVGRRDEALTAAIQAKDIYERLARTNPDAYEPDWAGSLNNLGSMYSAVGRRDEALTTTIQAKDIYERLARTNPDAYEPDWAGSLNNLGARYSAVGRRDEALTAAIRSVEIRERLARTNPDAYEPDLAGSLNNLGNRYSAVGRRYEALTAAIRAVEIRERLARTNPDAYEPNLAMSLNNLGAMYSVVGRRNEALTTAIRAVEIHERLARTNPDAYEPKLAMSLNNLGARYSEVGRHDEALTAAIRVKDVYERLARTNPDAYEPALAVSYGSLGQIHATFSMHVEASQSFGNGVKVLSRHFLSNPQAFAQLMEALMRYYLSTCEQAETDPDEELLAPLLPFLAKS